MKVGGISITAAAALFIGGSTLAIDRKPVKSRDDLPVLTYPVAARPSEVMRNAALFAPAMARMKADIERLLAEYDIKDRSTLRELHACLLDIATLQGDEAAMRRELPLVAAYADKPASRLLAPVRAEAWLDARRAGAPGTAIFRAAFARNYAARIAALPWPVVAETFKDNAGAWATRGYAVYAGRADRMLGDQIARNGTVDLHGASNLLFFVTIAGTWLPLHDEIAAADRRLIARHDAATPNIWRARAIVLPQRAALTPVVVAIWDSGIDETLFPGQLWTNPNERSNGKDDDGNGFVDDIHGIGFDDRGYPVTGPLMPVPADLAPRLAAARRLNKGQSDALASIASPDVDALTAFLKTATAEDGRRLAADGAFIGDWAHGTHVAGIVARGNPAVRLLRVRDTDDVVVPPRRPTAADVERIAGDFPRIVAYLRQAHVRIVNMSWSYSAGDYEDTLMQNGVAAADARIEAKQYMAIVATALAAAIRSAPDILFVCSAGNSGDDPSFRGGVPASFDFPNVLTVAAVDQAGAPASFTSNGPTVDLAANGWHVESVTPGGQTEHWSGTSMAAPQVVNVAAKLLAVRPGLTTAELRDLLVATATPNASGLKLLDGRAAMARLLAPPARR